jgi:hypothetical protein
MLLLFYPSMARQVVLISSPRGVRYVRYMMCHPACSSLLSDVDIHTMTCFAVHTAVKKDSVRAWFFLNGLLFHSNLGDSLRRHCAIDISQ